MEQVTVVFYSSIFPLKHPVLTDSKPHRISSKNEKKKTPNKKVPTELQSNQMLSKINESYMPIITFAFSISTT
jgi:hypothetical protein